MKSIHLGSRIGKGLLAASLLFGVAVGSNITVHAQNRDSRYGQDDRYRNRNDDYERNRRGRHWDRYGTYGGSFQLRQTALNAGYNEGIKEGRRDLKRGRNSDYRNSSAYRKATTDYSSRLGDKDLYRRYYREGFENGYADGLRGYTN